MEVIVVHQVVAGPGGKEVCAEGGGGGSLAAPARQGGFMAPDWDQVHRNRHQCFAMVGSEPCSVPGPLARLSGDAQAWPAPTGPVPARCPSALVAGPLLAWAVPKRAASRSDGLGLTMDIYNFAGSGSILDYSHPTADPLC
jgi:hypothetical protein